MSKPKYNVEPHPDYIKFLNSEDYKNPNIISCYFGPYFKNFPEWAETNKMDTRLIEITHTIEDSDE